MKFLLKKLWWLILIIVVILIIVFVSTSNKPKVEYSTAIVEKGILEQTVDATGSVEAAVDIDLHFQTSGQLIENLVRIGDQVKRGDSLAILKGTKNQYQLDQAAANLNQAQANLQKIIAGASPEDINVSQKTVDQAYVAYKNAENNLIILSLKADSDLAASYEALVKAQADLNESKQSLGDTQNDQNQAVINYTNLALTKTAIALADSEVALGKAKEIKEDANSSYFGLADPQALNDESLSYALAKNLISTALSQHKATTINSDPETITNTINAAINAVSATHNEISNLYQVMVYTYPSSNLTSTDISTYKTAISTQLSTVAADLSTLQTARQNLLDTRLDRNSNLNTYDANVVSAEQALAIAEANYNSASATNDSSILSAENQVNTTKAAWELTIAQLELKTAPARSYDVTSYQAQVNNLAAAYNLAKENFEDTNLKAPIDGIISKINFDPGENVSATETAVSLVNDNGYKISVDISETDITKIKLENKVDITLDAFGDDIMFTGYVSEIEPAQTVIQDVIYYRVTILFDEIEQDIKPGMTANVTIHTATKNNTLYIPRRAVLDKDNKKIVRVLDGDKIHEVEVQIGLRADNGLIEIISGLEEGETIVTFIKEE
ncbi:hypothetical protein COT97_02680 [Candidatus Falkowbacteria bacterium CG10_big_fil_rev_8_21_14_0_10_39_11]|uniref:Multidrug resistance protein MdtA-like barrel-sandwich hybrid domain-containing protein n=1 Tax=Candidatus Falkowbacteria bacterium CG10_big_fil_rev_8_21_14_0_10_39_11 TaxID=1974565 RepID=A0A2H0V516_9BACT|nr:MAG: hypothetical protein COT97_02680 [Candidatus Falkowbacteria bacterium CG10_big_fil_rev_8_21_14_0_10_39_11]